MDPSLAWITEFQKVLSDAMGAHVAVTLEDHVDPLKKLIVLSLPDKLGKGQYQPIQTLAHAFAKVNSCFLERIRRRPNALVLELSLSRRVRPVLDGKSDRNPLKE